MQWKRHSLVFVFVIGVVSIAAFAYGASRLGISNTGTVILANSNLFASVTGVTQSTVCSSLPSAYYADTGVSVAWPSLPQGTTVSVYICLKNTGSQTDLLHFATGPLPSGVSFGSPQEGFGVASSSATLCQLSLTATTTATTGGFNFPLTIT